MSIVGVTGEPATRIKPFIKDKGINLLKFRNAREAAIVLRAYPKLLALFTTCPHVDEDGRQTKRLSFVSALAQKRLRGAVNKL